MTEWKVLKEDGYTGYFFPARPEIKNTKSIVGFISEKDPCMRCEYDCKQCVKAYYKNGNKVNKGFAGNDLILPDIDFNKLADTSIDGEYYIIDGVRFVIENAAEIAGIEEGETTITVEPKRITFELHNPDYYRFLRNTQYIKDLIINGNYRVWDMGIDKVRKVKRVIFLTCMED